MALFGRRRREPPRPDEAFPYLTAEQGSRMRTLVREVLAEAGREVVVHADHVADDAGGQFGLANVAALCHNAPGGEGEWPQVVRDHLGRLLRLASEASPFDTWTPEQVLAATFLRVIAAEDLPAGMSYAREPAPGLAEVLNLDLPETVVFFFDEHVKRFGLADLRRAGLANLRGVEYDHHEVLGGDDGPFHALLGDLPYTASTVLLLPEVVTRYDAAPDPDLGVFVAVPNRHQPAFCAVRDGSAVVSLHRLAQFAAAGYSDGVGAVSPDVYWWRHGRLERITGRGEGGRGTRIEVGEDLQEVLEGFDDR